MYDFSSFIEDFKKFPPMYEVGRAYITMPGDEGYKGLDAETKRKAMKNVIRSGGQAPAWYKRNFEKLQKIQTKGKPTNGR